MHCCEHVASDNDFFSSSEKNSWKNKCFGDQIAGYNPKGSVMYTCVHLTSEVNSIGHIRISFQVNCTANALMELAVSTVIE